MFVKVHKAGTEVKTGNKGSCSRLADYLDKEKDHTFFSSDADDIGKEEVINRIDNNVKGLKAKDDKFYMLTINPSQIELQHMAGDKSKINYDDLSAEDKQKITMELEKYTRSVMDMYARNFGRDTIKSGDDLIYFARIETQRTYKHYDKEVDMTRVRPGDNKPGLNFHVHVIISRKSKDGKTALSPNAKSRGDTTKLKGREVKRGFDHEQFKTDCQKEFNKQTGFTFSGYSKKGNPYEQNKQKQQTRKNDNKIKSTLPRVSHVSRQISEPGLRLVSNKVVSHIKSATSGTAQNQVGKVTGGFRKTVLVASIPVKAAGSIFSLIASTIAGHIKRIVTSKNNDLEKE